MNEDQLKIKTLESAEKAKLAQLRRKKMEGELITKAEVVKLLGMLKDMSENGKTLDFDLLIDNVKSYSIH